MKKAVIIFFILFIPLSAQSGFEFLPAGLNFTPLRASYDEAKFGLLYFPDNGNLKVDIGNSIDLFGFNFSSNNSRLTFGADFTAYALATNYAGYRLQINAVDGFFGGNAVYSAGCERNKLYARFRIIHNSAHLVDGAFDLDRNEWINNKKPIPFTRDFAELLFAEELQSDNISFRFYGSAAYLYHYRPEDLKNYSLAAGGEVYLFGLFGSVFKKKFSVYSAVHITTPIAENTAFNFNSQIGVKFGEFHDKGILFYLSYFSGSGYFHEYYQVRTDKFGIGFSFDFN